MTIKRILTLLAMFSLAACAEHTDIRHSADYASILDRASGVTAVPATARVVTSDVSGNEERMYDYEYTVEDQITQIMVPVLRERGYRVKELRKAEIKEKKLYELVDQVNKSFANAYPKAYAPGTSDVKKAFALQLDLGDSAITLAEKSGEEIVVLSKYNEVVKTNGARAKDMAMDILFGTHAGAVAESAVLTVAIVDLKHSKVLWIKNGYVARSVLGSAISGASDQNEILEKNIKNLVAQALKDLPNKSDLLKQDIAKQ